MYQFKLVGQIAVFNVGGGGGGCKLIGLEATPLSCASLNVALSLPLICQLRLSWLDRTV